MKDAGSLRLVGRADELEQLCRRLAGADWLAVDTEFLRERTYHPKLCLVQVATAAEVFLIDPLALDDLGPLLDLLCDPGIVKVLHAARQDLEIFWNLRGAVPAPVFDTQIAAMLVGLPEQVGYAALVQHRLGVRLDKAHSRTDWSQRPLSAEQLEYAAEDVTYLAQLYPGLRDELAGQGRLDWLAPEFDALVDPARYENRPEDAWLRIKGTERLQGPQLAVLQRLAAWREETAVRTDRPRKWVLSDDALLALARARPRDKFALKRVRGLNYPQQQEHGETLLRLIAEAGGEKPRTRSGGEPREPLDTGQLAVVDLLMATLRTRAAEAGVNPGALGGRKDLERLVRGERDVPLLRGWRLKLAGERLLAVLEGEVALRARDARGVDIG